MAAAVAVIRKKNAGRLGKGKGRSAIDDEHPPDWATKSSAGLAWTRFWQQTQIDDKFWSLQDRASLFYSNGRTQAVVAALIVGNFLTTIVQMTVDPRELRYEGGFYMITSFFNVCFLIELIINLYAHWFWKFWWWPGCSWNWFDFLVVTLGMLDVFKVPMPGPLSLIRNLRAFRVFRLFKRIKALNQILKALSRAVAGVSSAFVVITIVMSIYAILGVAFFMDIGSRGHIVVEYGDYHGWHVTSMDGMSDRNIPFGEEYFGNFPRAMFTAFQLLLGDSFSDVGRIMIWGDHGPQSTIPKSVAPALGAFYIVTFMIINAVILTNVVVAVLLEKVIEPQEDEPTEDGNEGGKDSSSGEKADKDAAKKRKSQLSFETLDRQMALIIAELAALRKERSEPNRTATPMVPVAPLNASLHDSSLKPTEKLPDYTALREGLKEPSSSDDGSVIAIIEKTSVEMKFGLVLKTIGGQVVVQGFADSSPCASALMVNDRILSINGTAIATHAEAAPIIRGLAAGTVVFRLLRPRARVLDASTTEEVQLERTTSGASDGTWNANTPASTIANIESAEKERRSKRRSNAKRVGSASRLPEVGEWVAHLPAARSDDDWV